MAPVRKLRRRAGRTAHAIDLQMLRTNLPFWHLCVGAGCQATVLAPKPMPVTPTAAQRALKLDFHQARRETTASGLLLSLRRTGQLRAVPQTLICREAVFVQ